MDSLISSLQPTHFSHGTRPLRVHGIKAEIFHMLEPHVLYDVSHLVLEHIQETRIVCGKEPNQEEFFIPTKQLDILGND
jgi:hypothetical protein